MRLIIRFALIAVVVGLVLGLVLRPVLKRRRFGLLAVLSLLPVAAHAGYLWVISYQAGTPPGALLPFALVVLVLLIAGALLARRWARTLPLLAALTPGLVGLVYAVVASLVWSLSLEATGVVPNAVVGAAAGLATLAFVAMLLVFVPEPVRVGDKLRSPWRRP